MRIFLVVLACFCLTKTTTTTTTTAYIFKHDRPRIIQTKICKGGGASARGCLLSFSPSLGPMIGRRSRKDRSRQRRTRSRSRIARKHIHRDDDDASSFVVGKPLMRRVATSSRSKRKTLRNCLSSNRRRAFSKRRRKIGETHPNANPFPCSFSKATILKFDRAF